MIIVSPINRLKLACTVVRVYQNNSQIIERLKQCETHDAYWILSNAAGSPTFTYILRTSPCFGATDSLDEADKAISKQSLTFQYTTCIVYRVPCIVYFDTRKYIHDKLI